MGQHCLCRGYGLGRKKQADEGQSGKKCGEGKRKGAKLIHVLGIIFLFLRGKKD